MNKQVETHKKNQDFNLVIDLDRFGFSPCATPRRLFDKHLTNLSDQTSSWGQTTILMHEVQHLTCRLSYKRPKMAAKYLKMLHNHNK